MDGICSNYVCVSRRHCRSLRAMAGKTGAEALRKKAALPLTGGLSMQDDAVIRNCAPTLAGIKTGSIFPCPYGSREALLSSVRQMNQRLRPKGLRVLPLRFSDKKALIYLYRPKNLCADLADPNAADILARHGYSMESCEKCVVHLARKLRSQEEFPHEIGLFLGYPPEDVRGFIENKACGCKCAGCWKVYGDEDAAKKKFAQYKKCTRLYCDQWARGKDIERLTVADRRTPGAAPPQSPYTS